MFRLTPYYLLKWTSSARHYFSRRFTFAGIILLLSIITSALLGIDTNKTTAYEIFTLLLSILIIAIFVTFFSKIKINLSRKLPRFCTAGESIKYTITLENLTSREMTSLSISENLPDPRPTLYELEEEMISASRVRFLKRLFSEAGYFGAWRRQIRKGLLAEVENVAGLDIPPKGRVDTKMELLPLRRGYIHLKKISIFRPDPFGVIKKLSNIPAQDSLLVLPKRYPLPPVNLEGRRMHNQGGLTLASSVGNSDEFMALRDYRSGDPLKSIHWKSWAKTGKPVVKEYIDEHFSRHALILDTFGKDGKSELFEEAVSVAASFASSLERGESLLDLMFVGDDSYCFTSGRGMGSTEKMMEILASVNLCKDKPFSTLAESTLKRASLLSSAICIFIDWDDNRESFASKLTSLGIPLMVFVIAESGNIEKIRTSPIREKLENFHILESGKIGEGLADL